MKTRLEQYEASPEKFDEGEQNFLEQIREHGFFTTAVAGDLQGPGFCFTTGLYKTLGHSELITFGLEPNTAHAIFSELYGRIKSGEEFLALAKTPEIFEGLEAFLLPVKQELYEEYLGYSRWFYHGNDFPCQQLVWPDMYGVFPWEDGFDEEMDGAQVDVSDGGWGQVK